jgi:DNA sulfur modification protein DndE
MKPPVETVRISQQGRDQLIKLKRTTGLEHWNTICRWALCVSLHEKSTPLRSNTSSLDGGVEIPWKIFSGDLSSILAALVAVRAKLDGIDTSDYAVYNQYFRDHIHRGLGYLSSGKETAKIDDLFDRWLKP